MITIGLLQCKVVSGLSKADKTRVDNKMH